MVINQTHFIFYIDIIVIFHMSIPNLYVNLQWFEIEHDREWCSKNEMFLVI